MRFLSFALGLALLAGATTAQANTINFGTTLPLAQGVTFDIMD